MGRHCTSVKRWQHRIEGHEASDFGPLEFGWSGGEFTTLDVKGDWTLELSLQPWSDPFATATAEYRAALAKEVGLWEPMPLSEEFHKVMGSIVTAVDPLLNEMGELTGLKITFGDVVVLAKSYEGNLLVSVS